MSRDFLTIALPKGKLLTDSLEVLIKAGIECGEVSEESRKLLFPLRMPKHKLSFAVRRIFRHT